MSFETTLHKEALKHYKAPKMRKRFLVNEGDLFTLYKEICAIRKKEDKQRLMADFKTLLREAQPVKLVVTKKGGNHEQ